MDHGNEHGEHLGDDIIADNDDISDVQAISDDDDLSDEIESLDDEEASGEGTSDDDELSDESVLVHNEETSDNEMPDEDELSNESASVDGEFNTNDEIRIMSQIESNDPSMTCLNIDDDFYPPNREWANLGRVMGRNTHLKELWVMPLRSRDNFNGLFRGLISNRSIQTLTLYHNLGSTSIDDEGANIFAGLIRNAPIKKLEINDAPNMTRVGWLAIFTALQMNPTCRLEQLILGSNNINEAAGVSLSNVLLHHRATFETLYLCNSIQNMTIAGWLAFLQPLQDPSCRLKKLDLTSNANAITDEVAAVLTNALANISMLRELDLSYSDVTATGWVGFSTVLRNPNSALEILDLSGNHINDHVMTSFADVLANNNMLRELNLDLENVSYDGYAAFNNILCNNASILSTYHSNHSLEKLCHTINESSLPEDLRSLLRINREKSNSQAARIKIIKTHFSGSNINTQIFARMEVHVLPTVIAWMGRGGGSDVNGDLLFAFLRSMPLLCDTKSKSKQMKMAG